MFWRYLISAALFLAFCFKGLRAEPFVIQGHERWPQDLQSSLRYVHQPLAAWDAEIEIPAPEDFQVLEAKLLKQMHRGVNWIAIEISNRSPRPQSLSIAWNDFYFPIEAYERSNSGALRKLSTTEANSFETGFFHLHFDLEVGQSRSFWIRFQKDLPRGEIPLRLLERESFQYIRNIEIALRTLFVGCTLTIFFYNLFYVINLRERAYGIYGLYVFFLLILLISQFSLPTLLGVGNDFFSRYRFYIGYTSYELALIACLAYSIEFLDLHRIRPMLAKRLQLYYPFTILSYPVIFWAAPFYENIFALKFVGMTIYIPFLSISIARRGNLATKLYAFGFSILLIGNLINLLATFSVIPISLFTMWVAPGCAVIEMLTLSFALSEKVRADQDLSRRTIETLNRDLHESNTKLTQSFQSLQHEVLSRNSMVEDLSHRGNNPLHAASLAIDNIRLEILAAEQLLNEIFGPEELLTEEAKECLRSFRSNFASIQNDMSITRYSLYRMADAIKEIRLMSEVNEHVMEWVSWSKIMDATLQRLRENLSDKTIAKLKVSHDSGKTPEIHVHPLALTICLERLFRRLFKSSTGALTVAVRFEAIDKNQGRILISYSSTESLGSEGVEDLGAALAYILSHQNVKLYVRQEQIVLELGYRPQISEVASQTAS